MRRIFLFIIAVLAMCSCSSASLRCNFVSADISTLEDEHVVLAGFAARDGLSDGIHIPLRTHALAVTDGQQKICIISNDVMEISPSLAGEIRTEISKRSGLPYDNILLHCIHTPKDRKVQRSSFFFPLRIFLRPRATSFYLISFSA